MDKSAVFPMRRPQPTRHVPKPAVCGRVWAVGLIGAAIGAWGLVCLPAPLRADDSTTDRACIDPARGTSSLVRLAAVTPDGDIRLDDGRLVRLRSIQSPLSGADLAAFPGALAAWRAHEVLLVMPEGAAPDRWGRLSADIVDSQGVRHLGLSLLRAGLALVEPGHPDMSCRQALARAEEQARAAGAGLWAAAERRAAVNAGDAASVLGMLGRPTVIEGQIVSISERQHLTYLNFARRWRDGVTVTVPRRLWRDMANAGWTKTAAEGRRVRVRGTVESNGNGPVLALSSGAAIEALD